MQILYNTPKGKLKKELVLSLFNAIFFTLALMLITANEEPLRNYIVQGVFFGLAMGFITPRLNLALTKKKTPKTDDIPLSEEEEIKFIGGANLYKNKAGSGGKLVLTNSRLIFTSPRLIHDQSIISLPIKEITSAKPVQKNWLVEEIFAVHATNEEFRFVSYDREKWIEEISKAAETA